MAIQRRTLEERLKGRPSWINNIINLNFDYSPTLEFKARPPIRNLVIEGGGVKGIGFIGAINALDNYGELNNLEAVAGSSAGGITATLIALGYTTAEIREELDEMNLEEYFYESNGSWWNPLRHLSRAKQVGKLIFGKNHGFSDGKKFVEWAEKMVEKKNRQ